MTELTRYSDIDDMLVESPSYDVEADTIIRFYSASKILQEVAVYRLYRMYINKAWTDRFANGSDFITNMSAQMGISSRVVYERLKTYDIFQWLGVYPTDAIKRTTESPHLYSQIFKALVVDWDLETHLPGSVKIPGIDEIDSEATKQKLLDVVNDSEHFDTQTQALDNIKANILGAPVIHLYVKDDDDAIYADWEFGVIDGTGQRQIESFGHVQWLPDGDVPDEVIEAMHRRIRKQ